MIAWLRRLQQRLQDRRQKYRVYQQGLCGWDDCKRPQAPYLVNEAQEHWTLCPEHKKEALNGPIGEGLAYVADQMKKWDEEHPRPKPEDR